MDIEKMCRCCLTNEGPLLTIYAEDGGATNNNKNTLADMIREITKIKPNPNDKLPDKACLNCVKDIHHCFDFKLKCKNSYKTLQQLFCSIAQVELQNPFNTSTSIDIKRNQIVPPVDSLNYIRPDDFEHTNNSDEILKEETNLECLIPKNNIYKDQATTSAENCISIPSSPISFRVCSPAAQTTTYSGNHNDTAELSNGEITDNQQEFTDTDTNSYDLEFIAENPKIHEPIVILDDEQDVEHNTTNVYDQVDGVDAPDVEFTFQNISSPQWIGEEDNTFLSLVNEDLRLDNVQTMNKAVEKPKRRRKQKRQKRQKVQKDGAGSRYQCDICQAEFIEELDFNNHFDTHEKPYSCLYCNHLFDDYLDLQVHLLNHNNDTIKKDSKTTSSISNLTTPKIRKKPSRKHFGEKRFACEFCEMKFYAPSVLANHIRIHTGEKPYKCSYCDRSFIQSSTRSNHERTHTGEKRFKCQYCDKTFIQSGTCKSHEMIHTGVKRFKCRFCNRRFIQQGVLQTHEMTHTKEKKYKCSICFKGFSKAGLKTRHEKEHEEKNDIKCPQCNLWFVDVVDANEHVYMYHNSILNSNSDTLGES